MLSKICTCSTTRRFLETGLESRSLQQNVWNQQLKKNLKIIYLVFVLFIYFVLIVYVTHTSYVDQTEHSILRDWNLAHKTDNEILAHQ